MHIELTILLNLLDEKKIKSERWKDSKYIQIGNSPGHMTGIPITQQVTTNIHTQQHKNFHEEKVLNFLMRAETLKRRCVTTPPSKVALDSEILRSFSGSAYT